MKNAIITPTYLGHFQYIPAYLESFERYVLDKESVAICFVIEKDDIDYFKFVIDDYVERSYVQIIAFEDVLENYGVEFKPADIRKRFGRFTYQTLKKFYAMLYVPAERFFVLDSESMWIKETVMQDLFDSFFQNPFVTASSLKIRKSTHELNRNMIRNANILLEDNCEFWTIENFSWFIDKKILEQMFSEIGSPIDCAELILQKNADKDINEDGIMEAVLYQNYLLKNSAQLGYEVVSLDNELRKFLGDNLEPYLDAQASLFNGGGGLLEHAMILLSKKNYRKISNVLINNRVKVIRCEFSDSHNYRLQKKAIKIIQPNILAASQRHWFGINSKYKKLS